MKQLVRKMMIIFGLAMAFMMAMPATQDVQAAVRLNKTIKAIKAGTSYKLKLTGTSRTIKWYSSDESIATVSSNGRVTGISPGKTMVVAKVGNKKYKCQISVTFNADVAKSNLDVELQECSTSVVAIFTNNNTFSINLEGVTRFYDVNEDEIKDVKDKARVLEPGRQAALVFEKPEGAESYNFKYDVMAVNRFYTGMAETSVFAYEQGTDYVETSVTNESDELICFLTVAALMYDDNGNLIYADSYLTCSVHSGNTSRHKFSLPKAIKEEYVFASCKAFLNSAY